MSEYISDYEKKGEYNVTQSAIDIAKTPAAITAFMNFGSILSDKIVVIRPELQKIRLQCQTYEMADYIDLIYMAKLISEHIKEPAVINAAKDVIKTASGSIISSGKLGDSVRNSHGMSIWFPATKNLYFDYRAKYLSLKCNRGSRSGWVKFLDEYHG